MKKILFFLLISVSVNAQISTRCKVCPPSLDGVPDGYVLTDSSGYARWQASGGGGGSSWSLTGNSGTNPATDFVGTTDNVDLNIKRNSILTGFFSTGGAFLFGDISGLGEKQKFGITGGVATLQARRRFEVLDTTTAVLFKVDKAQSRIQLGLNTLPLTDTGYSIGSSSFRLKEVRALRGYFDGAIAIADGTQGNGKVLTSDANGLAYWGSQILTDTATLDFGNILANGHEVKTITVTGAALSDVVSLGIPNVSMNAHASFVAWVSASDTVSVKCFNFDGSSFDPASGLFKIKVFK